MKIILIPLLLLIKPKIHQFQHKLLISPIISFLEILIIFLITYLTISVIRTIIVSIYRKKHNYSIDHFDNLILGVDKLFKVVIFILTTIGIFIELGVDFHKFLTTLALFGVAIVLLFKDNLSNIIDGIIIMFSDELKLNEFIKIEEFKGKIIDINFLNIELKTGDGNIVFVPNAKVLNSEIINYSKSKTKTIRNEFYLDFGFFGKIDKLEDEISKELKEQFKEVSGLDSVELEIEDIRFNRVKVNLLITVSKYTLSIDSKISKFASRFILEFVHKHKRVSTVKKIKT